MSEEIRHSEVIGIFRSWDKDGFVGFNLIVIQIQESARSRNGWVGVRRGGGGSLKLGNVREISSLS